jgi:protein-L-isoaspartate(D-aspartate) O-methyltransferase
MVSKESLIDELVTMGIDDKKVLDAIRKIGRERFIPKELAGEAYGNYPLPIGFGQTISQPYTVAFMAMHLDIEKGSKILEIGTGCGYNAAILSILCGKKGHVYTVEIIPELADLARENLKAYPNVDVIFGDGSVGYEKNAPYDRIIITAASPEIPSPLYSQLKEHGIIIAPVESSFGQQMMRIRKDKTPITDALGAFSFVPLKGKYGYM